MSQPPEGTVAFLGNIAVPRSNPYALRNTDQSRTCTSSEQSDSKNSEVNYIGSDDEDIIILSPSLEIRLNHVLQFSPFTGKITHFESSKTDRSKFILMSAKHDNETAPPVGPSGIVVDMKPNEFIVPGFVDMHIHAPQYSYGGTATDVPLMGQNGWLEKYAFPSERSLEMDLHRAHDVFTKIVRRTLDAGTTTAVYFATLHLEPCKVLSDVVSSFGQRALIGKVCMDRHCPPDYCHSTEQNLKDTRTFVEYVRGTNAGRIGLLHPVITPRFIPTCTAALLKGLGDLAAEFDCHVQSHISESIDEVEFSKMIDTFDDDLVKQSSARSDDPQKLATSKVKRARSRTDAEIFDSHGLLRNNTIMAHGVFLSSDDCHLLRERGSAVAHCPLSNFYFAGAPLPCRRIMELGNKVGLGTDIAGGYSPSMMNASRFAVIASRSWWHAQHYGGVADADKDVVLDYTDAFYLSTLGGAEALGFHNRIGTFRVGMEFDALLVSAEPEVGNIDLFDSDETQDVFQKICCLGDDRNIRRVYVRGREVKKV